MTTVNQNLNNGYNIQNERRIPPAPMHRVPAQPQVRIPAYYQTPPERLSIKEAMEQNPFMMIPYQMAIKPFTEHPAAILGSWVGISLAMDQYTKACGGEYEKSLLKKAVKLGDRIESSQVIQNKPVQSFLSSVKGLFNKSGKIAEKNSVLRAIKNTPSNPEWEMCTSEMLPQRQRIVHDFSHIMSTLKIGEEGYAGLHKLAVSKEEKAMLKKVFNVSSLSQIPENKASVQIQLKRLGLEQDKINIILKNHDGGVAETKNLILKIIGKDTEWIKKIKEDSLGNYTDEVQAASKKLSGKVKVGFAKFKPLGINLGWLTKPIERTLGMDEVHNRLASLSKEGAKTATGRFMAKTMQMIHRGLTFGGGKVGLLLFIAPALVESAINVKKAENNQKVSTGISSFINHISWVITFPLGLKLMHHLGGAQYSGLSKDQVTKCREIRNKFNAENKKGKYKNNAKLYAKELAAAQKEIEKITKPIFKKQNIFTKGIRKLARFMCWDLERFDGRDTGNFFKNKFTKIRNLPRNIVGVPMRFLIWGMITMFGLEAVLSKGLKLLLGESFDAEKEEDRKSAAKEQKKFLKEDLEKRLYETQLKKQMTAQQSAQVNPQTQMLAHRGGNAQYQTYAVPNNIQQTGSKNSQKADNYTYIPSQENSIKASNNSKSKVDNYTYIPSQNCTIRAKDGSSATETRTYIPSQEAAKIEKSWDNSGLNAALSRADRAENKALRILAGNFDGM